MRGSMWRLLLLAVVLACPGCIAYEYDHEVWLRVDGSGSVTVTGRPELWRAFKGYDTADAARAAFSASGLRVRRATVAFRDGRSYLSVAADFDDVNRLSGSPAFPDLSLSLRHEGDRLLLAGVWSRRGGVENAGRDGLMAVRLHLPSRVHEHRNAVRGVERGNILSWEQGLGTALDGGQLDFGAVMDERSILLTTVRLFGAAIALALLLLAAALAWLVRKGRRAAAMPPGAGLRGA
jgi:hypothetical protein